MSFEVIATDPFERKFKRLSKKYKSLHNDLEALVDQLSANPAIGVLITKDCFKIRLAISSKLKVVVQESSLTFVL